MARKLSQDRREKFLEAALKLFVANGVQRTSTADIAKEAGSAAGTLFLYFPTKQDLIDELVLKIAKEQAEHVTSLLKATLSARDTFFAIWNGTIRWFMENMDAYLYIQQVRDSGMVSEAVAQETQKFFGYYFDAIQKGRKEGAIQPYSLELIGDFLYHDIVAVMNRIRAQSDPTRQEEAIQIGFEIFWNGVKKHS